MIKVLNSSRRPRVFIFESCQAVIEECVTCECLSGTGGPDLGATGYDKKENYSKKEEYL
jgi:hypothetical protein